MKRILFLVLGFLFLVPIGATAQTAQDDEVVSIKKSQLTSAQIAAIEQQNMQAKIETYGKWVGLGKEVGEAVNGSLSALSTQADAFAKTGVGKFTMVLVAYKVVGGDLLDVLIAAPLMIVMTCLFIWSYRKSCITRSVLVSDLKEEGKKYKIVNPSRSDDSQGDPDLDVRRTVHVVIYLIVMGILVAIAV